MTREDLVATVLANAKDNVLLDVFQRVGKSMMCVELIKKWGGKALILVPNTTVLSQWVKNIETYNPILIGDIDVYCYQSIHKIEDVYDIVCLDEMHLAQTDIRIEHIQRLNPKHWIGMSGTLNIEDRQMFRVLTKNKFWSLKVTLEDAVTWGILPEPKVVVVPLEFDKAKQVQVYERGHDKTKKTSVCRYEERWEHLKNRKVNLRIQCTEEQYHDMIVNDISYLKKLHEESPNIQSKRNWINKGLKRKKWLAEIKTKHVLKLLKIIKEKRVLVFCESIKQADIINRELSVHSLKENPLELVKRFNDGDIRMLTAVGMLDMGVDIKELDYAVIVQLGGSDVASSQKMARGLLSKSPRVVVFYYPGTQDEIYLNRFLENFKKEWITYKKL